MEQGLVLGWIVGHSGSIGGVLDERKPAGVAAWESLGVSENNSAPRLSALPTRSCIHIVKLILNSDAQSRDQICSTK